MSPQQQRQEQQIDNTAREQLQQQLQQQEQAARDGSITGEDSLTLLQLRRLLGADGPTAGTAVQTVPEPTPYAFTYADASSLPEEIEEWFSYGLEERARVAKCHASFMSRWTGWNGTTFGGGRDDWVKASLERRKEFVRDVLRGLGEGDVEKRVRDVETLVYIVLGVWDETSGLKKEEKESHDGAEKVNSGHFGDEDVRENGTTLLEGAYENFGRQIDWIRMNTDLLIDCGALPTTLELVKTTCERAW
jgi:N1221-like protein